MTRSHLERLLTLEEAAAVTSTTERLWRRLVFERRVRYVKVGRYVRVPESAVADFVESHTVAANTVEPSRRRDGPSPRRGARAAGDEPIRYLERR